MKAIVGDIHSYTIFANIDNRKGEIEGHFCILSKEQMETIEDIILSTEKLKVKEEVTYILEVE